MQLSNRDFRVDGIRHEIIGHKKDARNHLQAAVVVLADYIPKARFQSGEATGYFSLAASLFLAMYFRAFFRNVAK